MKRVLAVLAVGVLAAPSAVSAGDFTVRFGAFFPRAGSTLFSDDADLYTREVGVANPAGLKASDWDGFSGGIAYFTKVAPNLQLGFSIDGYSRRLDTSYRQYTHPDGSEIEQSLRVNMVPFGVSLRLTPTSRRVRLAPYVEVGADAIYYKYEEFGDFIDFFDGSHPISTDSFRSSGVGYGFHVAAGLKVPLNRDFSLVGEARYEWAKDQMRDDFRGSEIDLGGLTATVGFNVRF